MSATFSEFWVFSEFGVNDNIFSEFGVNEIFGEFGVKRDIQWEWS